MVALRFEALEPGASEVKLVPENTSQVVETVLEPGRPIVVALAVPMVRRAAASTAADVIDFMRPDNGLPKRSRANALLRMIGAGFSG